MSNDVKDLRRQVKESEIECDNFLKKSEDLNDQLEMAMLDREVAEERSEEVQAKLDTAKERLAELEVELEVLRQEEGKDPYAIVLSICTWLMPSTTQLALFPK